MVREINEKEENTNSKEKVIEEKTNTKIFKNVLTAILIMAYLVGITILSKTLSADAFKRVLQVFTMVLLTVTITIFEIAYKKDSGILAISGIEALVIACHALAIQYVTTAFNWDLKWYTTISGYVFAIYFVFKSIVVYTSGKKEYLNSFSDVAEIVKEEPQKKKAVKHKKSE